MPTKIATVTSTTKKDYDESFAKNTFCIHPTIIPFLTAMELSDTNQYEWDDRCNPWIADFYLKPFIAPVNHNTLNVSKTFQIVHTLMGNFCHRDKDKISQMEDMGNNATVLIGYHDKVSFEDICQIIQIMNYLFHYLTLLFINKMSLTKQKNQLK